MAAFIIGLAFLLSVPAFAQSARDRAKAAAANGDYTTAAKLYEDAVKESPRDKDVLIEAGDANMELDRYDVARDFYKHAVDLDSKDAVANQKYGLALSELNDHPRAIEALQRALKSDESLANYLALGRAYIAAGKDSLSKAELTFQKANLKFPNSADVAVALGDLYFAREIYPLAQEKYEEALKLNDTLIESRVRLGRTYRELAKRSDDPAEVQANYNKALLEFNRVTALAPRNARAWYEQGDIFRRAEQYEKAGQSFATYVELRPEDPRGDIQLALSAYQGNFFKQAIEPLERIVKKSDPVSLAFRDSAMVMLGKSYYAVKDYVNARQAYSQAKDSLLGMEGTKFYVSSILLSGGDTVKALDLYRRVVDANPKDCDLSSALGGLLYQMKKYDAVIDVFSQRMINCPDAPKATPYLYIGLSNFAQKRYDKAVEALNLSIAADSSSAQGYYWLMNAYATQKQFGKAADIGRLMAERGMDKTNPKEVATGYFFGGTERFQAKDFKGAIAELDKSLKLNPENAQAYLYTAFSYQSMNDKENACKYYKLVLKYDPKNADAIKNMKPIGCQ
jgi:tetratricopeptide (TPR) repeat protein